MVVVSLLKEWSAVRFYFLVMIPVESQTLTGILGRLVRKVDPSVLGSLDRCESLGHHLRFGPSNVPKLGAEHDRLDPSSNRLLVLGCLFSEVVDQGKIR
jgi:hypothetical protein